MTGGDAPALRVTDLGVGFGDAPGLERLSVAVDAGERLAIVGASGAGKTTLLRAVAGLAPVSAGRVEVRGRDVTHAPPERRAVVYLHQTPVLFPHLSVFENVAFAMRVRRAPEPEVRRRVGALLDAMRLADFGPRAPRTLSGGQRHRVALARAMAARPAVLLLDEPLSALDPALRADVRDAVLAAQETAGADAPALVVVTHDFDEAGLLAHRIAVLVEGRIAQDAEPAALFRRPASLAVARFLGVANELAGRVRADGAFECVLGTLPAGADEVRPGPAVAVCHAAALHAAAAETTAETTSNAGPRVASGGRAVALRHRAERTTAVVDVAGTRLEVSVDQAAPPAPGAIVRVLVDPRQLTIFATDANTAP